MTAADDRRDRLADAEPCAYCGSVRGETPPSAYSWEPLTGETVRSAIDAACSLINPRLSEVDWDAVAACMSYLVEPDPTPPPQPEADSPALDVERLRRIEAAAWVLVRTEHPCWTLPEGIALHQALTDDAARGGDAGSEYGRLLAQRDRLIAEGADPAELEKPEPPG